MQRQGSVPQVAEIPEAGKMNWRAQRRKDRQAQKEYFENHQFCEICLAEGRGKRLADEVHEILYRSQGGKCVPENEISTCRSDHDRMHFKKKLYLAREQVLVIKERMVRKEEIVFGAKGGMKHLQRRRNEDSLCSS